MTHLEKLIELAEAHDAKKAEAFNVEVIGTLDFDDIFPDKDEAE